MNWATPLSILGVAGVFEDRLGFQRGEALLRGSLSFQSRAPGGEKNPGRTLGRRGWRQGEGERRRSEAKTGVV